MTSQVRAPRTSRDASSSAVARATVSTACSKAAALCAAGCRNPDTFRTYWRAAAWTSSSVVTSWKGGRKVFMLRHIYPRYGRIRPAKNPVQGIDVDGAGATIVVGRRRTLIEVRDLSKKYGDKI